MKKGLSIILSIAIILSSISLFAFNVNATETLSGLQSKLPQGTYWNHAGTDYSTYNNNRTAFNLRSTSTPCNHSEYGNKHCSYSNFNYTGKCGCNSYGGSTQCMGFARFICAQLFGNTPNGEGNSGNGWQTTSISNLKVGDYIRYKRTSSHYGHSVVVTEASDSYIKVGECNADGKCGISWTRLISKSTLNGYYSVKCLTAGGTVPDISYTKDTRYPTPITCYPTATSGLVTLYDSSLNAYPTSTRNISYSDECTINEVYTNGYCSVTYPTASGKNTELAKFSDFNSNAVPPYSWSPSTNVNTYKRVDMAESFGAAYTTDNCTVIGQSGNKYQIIYPVSGGYKLGWVDSSYTPVAPPVDRTPTIIPGPVASGAFNGKQIVAVAPHKIVFSSTSYIDAGDICRLYNVDPSTGYCTVDYPSLATDVFKATTIRTATVAINEFINYNGSAQAETTTIDCQLTSYPTSDMTATVGSYNSNWWLDAGDTYTTINKINGATEILYYCSTGAHAGYWKLGWVWLDYFTLDLNGYTNGAETSNISGYGTADVYINGIKRADDVSDFHSANGSYPRGSTYEIKDIRAYNGYTYNGVYSGSTTGSLTSNKTTALNFSKNAVTLSAISVNNQPTKTIYLEGESLNTSGLKINANYSDGTNKDVTSYCTVSGYSSTPGMKTVTVDYGGKQTAFTVNVLSKSPSAITVVSPPNKTEYEVGDEIDISGLIIKATYDNGTAANIVDYYIDISDELTASAGTKSIAISYVYNNIDVETEFAITVKEKPVQVDAELKLESKSVTAGETFDVDLCISENPGIVSIMLAIEYDTSLLELKEVRCGEIFKTSSLTMGGKLSSSPYKILFIDETTRTNYTANGTLATYNFTAKSDMTPGTVIPIKLSYSQSDTFDVNLDDVKFKTVDSSITVIEKICSHESSTWEVVTAPTCTEKGKKQLICNDCKEIIETADINSLGHKFGNWQVITAATATSTGLKRHTCTRSGCGVYEDEVIPATGEEEKIKLSVNNYTVSITNADNISSIRYAPGEYATAAAIKRADGCYTISSGKIAANTVDGVFKYEMPNGGVYSFSVKLSDGNEYVFKAELNYFTQELSSVDNNLTVTNLYGVSDIFFCTGHLTKYSDVKAKNIFRVTASKINGAKKYTYPMPEIGEVTVYVKYADANRAGEFLYTTLTAPNPTITQNGLDMTIDALSDVKCIRRAYGTYTTLAAIKNADAVVTYNGKELTGGADTAKIHVPREGTITICIQYKSGYTLLKTIEVVQKRPTFKQNGNSVTIGDIDDLYVIRYAKGTYTKANAVKNAPGCVIVRSSAAVDGQITIDNIKPGTYTFLVQYNDQSQNIYTVTVQ